MLRHARSKWLFGGCILAAAAVLGPLSLAGIGLGMGNGAFLWGMLFAVVPVPFYIAFTLWVDRFEPEPPWLLAIAFLWGASIAVFFALVFNSMTQAILTRILGAAQASTLTGVLAAPFVEELAKGAALALLFFREHDQFDNVTDGIVFAGMVGLGFAMTENVQYYGHAAASSEGAIGVVIARGVLSPFAHPLYTSMTGIGFGLARESDRRAVKWLAPVGGLGLAMLFHGIWNLTTHLGPLFFVSYALIMVPSFIAVIVIVIVSLRREARIIRAHLECVVADGLLSGDDVAVVTSVRRRVAASTRALFRCGLRQWMARRRFHVLATKLAFHAWRCSRATREDSQVVHAELVEAVRAARLRMDVR